MPFEDSLRSGVDRYASDHLDGDLDAHVARFSFLQDDPDLQRRVGEEYYSARYLYKLWEGLRVEEDWGSRAQVQLQVQQYASIYEACLHHLLFERCGQEPRVEQLLEQPVLKKWCVSEQLREQLAKAPTHGPKVVAALQTSLTLETTQVRFEHKVDAAVDLGMIDEDLGVELKEFYSARNMIHIHAEMRNNASGWTWEFDFAERAYRRLKPFCDRLEAWHARQV
jgi:hypothetical protein